MRFRSIFISLFLTGVLVNAAKETAGDTAVKNPDSKQAAPVVDTAAGIEEIKEPVSSEVVADPAPAAKTEEIEAPATEEEAAGQVLAVGKVEEKAPDENALPDEAAAETAGGEEEVQTPESQNETAAEGAATEAPISPAETEEKPSEETSANSTNADEATAVQSPLQEVIAENGTCSAHGKCECYSGYAGKNCEKAINFCHKKLEGILDPKGKASLAEACKPHGKCVSETGKGAICECNKGWSGNFCNNPDENHSITKRCLYRRGVRPIPPDADKSVQVGCGRRSKTNQFCVPDNLNCLLDYPKQNCSYPIGWCVQREFSLVQLMTKLSKRENRKRFKKILKR